MNLESQVSSLHLSQRLKELGVKQKSLFYWSERDGELVYAPTGLHERDKPISAFTVAELGEMLPHESEYHKTNPATASWENGKYCATYIGKEDDVKFYASTEADARAKMLIYLVENKLITV